LDCNEVWTNPHLPSRERRSQQALRLEVSVLESFEETLAQLEHRFGEDSTLAAIMRNASACHFLVYTAAGEAEAHDRCHAVREALRLPSMGCSVAQEPAWQSALALDDVTLPATMSPWIADGIEARSGER
jgi:hypothetical protein